MAAMANRHLIESRPVYHNNGSVMASDLFTGRNTFPFLDTRSFYRLRMTCRTYYHDDEAKRAYFTLRRYAEREAWEAEVDAYMSSEELKEERAAEFDEWLAKNDDDTHGDMV